MSLSLMFKVLQSESVSLCCNVMLRSVHVDDLEVALSVTDDSMRDGNGANLHTLLIGTSLIQASSMFLVAANTARSCLEAVMRAAPNFIEEFSMSIAFLCAAPALFYVLAALVVFPVVVFVLAFIVLDAQVDVCDAGDEDYAAHRRSSVPHCRTTQRNLPRDTSSRRHGARVRD